MAPPQQEPLYEGIEEAQQRTGVKAILVNTPWLPVDRETPAKGLDLDEVARILDDAAAHGTTVCMPHQSRDRCPGGSLHAGGPPDGAGVRR